MCAWLARRGGEVRGRVAAIVDEHHLRRHRDGVGFFGFFEVLDDPEVARELLGAARGWLRGKGMKRMRGPASPSLNYECGLLVDAFDSPPVILMPYNPPAYADYFERSGLAKARDLYAYRLDLEAPLPDVVGRAAERARRSGLRIRPAERARLREELARCREVFEGAWQDNWGFVPLTEEEWGYLGEEFGTLLYPELMLFAEHDGRTVGLAVALPDVNPVLRGLRTWHWPLSYLRLGLGLWKAELARLTLLGVVPGHQSVGVGAALYQELHRGARSVGYRAAEISWVLEDNVRANRSAEALGARRYKTYRMYETSIPS
jgi:GNAT superfamily N-acetyltransferase